MTFTAINNWYFIKVKKKLKRTLIHNMNRNRIRGFRGANKRFEKGSECDQPKEESLIVKQFREYNDELMDKHDRYERLVKKSRDITIESKRLIFLLHSIDSRSSDFDKCLSDAFNRLMVLCDVHFLNVAKELAGNDQYQYVRAYSAGLQEFIEAHTYYLYLKKECIFDWGQLQKKFTYEIKPEQLTKNEDEIVAVQIQSDLDDSTQIRDTFIKCLVQPNDFMLGLADLSGEIMRKCVNSLGVGDVDACYTARNFIQKLYSGYLCIGPFRNREMSRKVYTMHQSVLKVEKVCYNVKVRGKEAAKWISNDAQDATPDEDARFITY